MFQLILAILLSISTSFVNCKTATGKSERQLEDNIDQIIKPYVDHHVFSGSVLVAKNGEVILSKGYGLANKEWQISNTAESKYGIGSLTKSVTAILIMQQVERGRLKLSDTIDKFLPNIPKQRSSRITIHHLLSHSSGLPNYFAIPGWTDNSFNKSISLSDFSKVLENMSLLSEPGEQYHYSNIGFFFLGQIIEKVSGKSYELALSENILEPLTMNNTGLHLSQIVLDKAASGYQVNKTGGFRQPWINRDLFRGTGNLYSTVGDLFLLDQALYSDKILSKESKAIMFDPKNSYGWDNGEVSIIGKQKKTIGYSGQVLGFNSMITRYVEDNNTVILLGNIGTSNFERRQLSAELSHFLYSSKQPEKTKTRLSLLLMKALVDGNIEQRLAAYSKSNSQYEADESGISSLGQQLGWTGLSELSIKLLEFNVKIFPESAGSLVNLARAFQRGGRSMKALKYFQLAHKVAPDNDYIKTQINKLGK